MINVYSLLVVHVVEWIRQGTFLIELYATMIILVHCKSCHLPHVYSGSIFKYVVLRLHAGPNFFLLQ